MDFFKPALTHTPDPNRSSAVNFTHVNGRSLYIIHCRMVVVVERGKCPNNGEGNVRGEYVQLEMSGSIVD